MKKIMLIAIMHVSAFTLQAQEYYVSYAELEKEIDNKIDEFIFLGIVSIDFYQTSIDIDNTNSLVFKFKGKWEKVLDGPKDDKGGSTTLYVQDNDTILMKYDAKKTFLVLLTNPNNPDMYADMFRLEIKIE